MTALTNAKVALTDNGEFRSTYDILSDIADVWDELDSMSQASIAESLAGTRQQDVFYSIIEQFQEASGAMGTMADSAGTLQESYDQFMESVSAHWEQLTAAFQALGVDLFPADTLNFFIDQGKAIINTIDSLVDSFGNIPVIVGVVAAALSTQKLGRDEMLPFHYAENVQFFWDTRSLCAY